MKLFVTETQANRDLKKMEDFFSLSPGSQTGRSSQKPRLLLSCWFPSLGFLPLRNSQYPCNSRWLFPGLLSRHLVFMQLFGKWEWERMSQPLKYNMEWHFSLPLSSHWPELSYMLTCSCKEVGKWNPHCRW